MRIGILGTLLVHDGDALRPLPAARQRAVLALLAVQARRYVSADQLAEQVWSGAVPAGGRSTLHSYINRLRSALGERAGTRLRTVSAGYLLELEQDELDASRFRSAFTEGHTALDAGDWERASGMLSAALAEWRGAAFEDVPGIAALDAESEVLSQQRLLAEELFIDAELELARHDLVLAQVQALAKAHPLREHVTAQHLLALHRAGRQADALAAYRDARTLLVAELGVEPGAELRDLHAAILSGTVPPPRGARTVIELGYAGSGSSSSRPAPAQLPLLDVNFTGRTAQLSGITEWLSGEYGPRLVKITGGAGIGKTALALQAAHAVADQFPDGQVYLGLRGAGPEPASAAEALGRVLRDLGVPGEQVPDDVAEREALLRSLTHCRRIVFVLDDARDAAQLRPLLPAEPGCGVIATSRARLASLTGFRDLALGTMPTAEASALFRRIAGTATVAADPHAAARIVAACGGLPLALNIAAARVAVGPPGTLTRFADRVADAGRRLGALAVDDLAVRAAFQTGFEGLRPPAAHAFRILGLWPGGYVTGATAAALLGCPEPEAADLLDELAAVCLLDQPRADRYRLHDLLFLFAREEAVAALSEAERADARARLLDWFIAEIEQAESYGWIEGELSNIATAVRMAHHNGHDAHCGALMRALSKYFELRKHWRLHLKLLTLALAGAERSGDAAQAGFLWGQHASASWGLGDYQGAADAWLRAADTFTGLGEAFNAARMLSNLSGAMCGLGRADEGAKYAEDAIAVLRKENAVLNPALINNLGMAYFQANRPSDAAAAYQESLALSRDQGDRYIEAATLSNLAELALSEGDPERAVAHSRLALELCDAVGSAYGRAMTLDNLATAQSALGETDAATASWSAALEVFDELGDAKAAAQIRERLAELGSTSADLSELPADPDAVA